MLEGIFDEATADLLLSFQHSALLKVQPDYDSGPCSIQQHFYFLSSILNNEDFRNAVRRLVSSPYERLSSAYRFQRIHEPMQLSGRNVARLLAGQRRASLPDAHPLAKTIQSLSLHPQLLQIQLSVDTPENRFVKFAFEMFSDFLLHATITLNKTHTQDVSHILKEISHLAEYVDEVLAQEFFKDVSRLGAVPFAVWSCSKDMAIAKVFKAWLNFNAGIVLRWSGGDQIYDAGKKDIATLYEYWLFFQFIALIRDVFGIEVPRNELFYATDSSTVGLRLRTGQPLSVTGNYTGDGRSLGIRFSYNKTFPHVESRVESGSWTWAMRPDFTLSMWPSDLSEEKAEEYELLVHVHFDAKYRVESLDALFGPDTASEAALSEERRDQKGGNYKRADLFKMHTYKDAIQRSRVPILCTQATIEPCVGRAFTRYCRVLAPLLSDQMPTEMIRACVKSVPF